MAIPNERPKKKSLLKAKTKPKVKTVKVASNSKGIKELQSLFESAMFAMGEGFIGEDANAHDKSMYYHGRDEARKYGKLLRQKGVMVKLP